MKIMYNLVDKFLMNSFDDEILKELKDKKQPIIFDIGCYKGNYSRNLNKKLKLSKNNFYLFDANPDLKINDFSYFNVVLSDKVQHANFYFNNFFPSSGSSLKDIIKNDKLWNLSRKLISFNFHSSFSSFEVKTNTLDLFCEENKINKINLLKIDVEGSEFDVLIGGKNILNNTDIIQLEILDKKNNFKINEKKIKLFLEKYNFKILKEKIIRSVSFLSNSMSMDILLKKGN